MGTEVSFPGGTAARGRNANHSPPASAEVKKMRIYTSTPPICLHGVVLNYLTTGTTFYFYTYNGVIACLKHLPGHADKLMEEQSSVFNEVLGMAILFRNDMSKTGYIISIQ
jgi:hypothetical protein